jgi:uncharacterized protein with ParB-like and HNH nuclease domain
MKASETNLQSIIDGTKQYFVPLFQRPYTWQKKNWESLWDDLDNLYEEDKPRPTKTITDLVFARIFFWSDKGCS